MRGLPLALVAAALAFTGAAGPAAADRYVHANNSAYDTLDPHVVGDVARVATRLNFYDGLYRWVDNPPQLIPWLATSHTVSDDGLVWTFSLRDDVPFHDGSLMTAEDVVWSVERMLALKRGASTLFLPVLDPGATKALDDTTVEFTLKTPSAIFGSIVSDIYVMNSDLVKENEVDGDWGQAWLTDHVAGSGSYMLDRYDPAVGFIGERFEDHFAGWGESYYDEIEFRTVLETNTRVQGLMRGDYQGLDGYLAPDQIARLRDSDNVQIIEQESMRVFHFAMNNRRPPFDDVNFRKAMAHAFDYEGFIGSILQDSVVRNPTIIPNNMWGAPKDVEGYTFDLEKAKEYLDKVEGPIRTIHIGTLAGFSETEQAASLLQNALAKIGVTAEIESAPWPVVNSRMQDPEQMYDMVPYWKSTYYADPNNWIGELYGARYIPTRNVSGYDNPEVNARLEKALVSTDQAERQTLYEEAARIVYDDAAGIWIYNTKWYGPYSTEAAGIRFSPVGNAQDMRWAHPAD
ncbi:ABC transporter substrate-binding protein [Oceanicella sp. SM1341]|uniref:ABC transporter substrate-binding protein n=1 Tax=Oceanicella sp. SM1341 TaxID=1548889 RepID=UPI000E549931|nr:ABC transporter substrate-binding protein [Oceanicella sp. SM1341]